MKSLEGFRPKWPITMVLIEHSASFDPYNRINLVEKDFVVVVGGGDASEA